MKRVEQNPEPKQRYPTPFPPLVYASYIDEPVVQLASDDARHYYHANRMFCVTAMTDGTGTVIERQLFTPYGELTLLEPNGSTARTASAVDFVTIGSDDYELTSLGHQGLPHDHETSLVYSRARLLDTQLGRFKGRDQMGYIDGLGLYKFVRNMPLRAWDPSGWASEQGCASQCWPPGKLQLAVTGLYVTQAGVAPEEDDKVELDIDLSKPPTSPAKATLDAIEDLAGAYAKALQFNIYLEVTLRRCENFICDGCIEVTRWSGKKKMLKQCNTGGILASGVGGTDGDETFSVVIMDQVENAVKNCMESVTP